MLTQPFETILSTKKRVLLAGCGGGYDVFGAVPLWFALRERGVEVHLASVSFTYLNGLAGAKQHSLFPNLYEVDGACATKSAYCPEAWMAKWLSEKSGAPTSVWCFEKTGVVPLRAAYEFLIRELGLDAIILIDGGVDAALKGDETSLGTPSEDLTTVCAVSALENITTMLACVGLSAELRDGICHEQFLSRVAMLTKENAFLGVSSLLLQTEYGKRYHELVEYTFANQEHQRKSHVHTVIALSMEGDYGHKGAHIWINPLMNMYWFFSLPELARGHLFLSSLKDTQSIWDVVAVVEAARKETTILAKSEIPI
jgi:hypothetical protein